MHGAHPMMNLIEGNHARDKFDADNYWGTSSHQTFIRNRMYNVTGKLYGSWGFDLYKGVRYYNIVGNVLGTDYETIYEIIGKDARGKVREIELSPEGEVVEIE